ncbi:MAG TPA: ATP-dependent DNA helicase, partial [Iamia sp.]|nr:ATP-dependent DNA helicase [Iamia sp.]
MVGPLSTAEQAVSTTLARVTTALPGGGEDRPGQVAMAHAVTRAIVDGRHVVVQAGTGTGKSLAYLVPAALSGKPVVVATATKALQDQLVGKDLPFLADHLDAPLTYAVLKGRSNYVCRQRLGEIDASAQQLALDGLVERAPEEELREIKTWAGTTLTGDRAELAFEPSPEAWAAVSVGSRECPGAARCPQGGSCFAEAARNVASEADVVVVNLHLYGLDLASDGAILPEHDVTIVDEAHVLDDIISATTGVEIGPGRFLHLGRVLRGILAEAGDTITGVLDSAGVLSGALAAHRDQRITAPLPDALAGALAAVRRRVEA